MARLYTAIGVQHPAFGDVMAAYNTAANGTIQTAGYAPAPSNGLFIAANSTPASLAYSAVNVNIVDNTFNGIGWPLTGPWPVIGFYSLNQETGAPSLAQVVPIGGANSPDPLSVPSNAMTWWYSQLYSPDGKFLYIQGWENNNPVDSLYTYEIDPQLGTAKNNGAKFRNDMPGGVPFGCAMSSDGKYLYAVSGFQDTGNIKAFSLDATTGLPTAIATYVVGSGDDGTIAPTIHPNGQFLYVTAFYSKDFFSVQNYVACYAINPLDGSRMLQSTTHINGGNHASKIAFDSTGQYMYVSCFGDGFPNNDPPLEQGIAGFSVNPVTGLPTQFMTPTPYVSTIGFGNSTLMEAVEADSQGNLFGLWAFSDPSFAGPPTLGTNWLGSWVAYNVNGGTGALTPVNEVASLAFEGGLLLE